MIHKENSESQFRQRPMSSVVEKLIEDVQPRPERKIILPPDADVDAVFRAWGGRPETVDNWQAIALTCLTLAKKWAKL